MKPVIGAEWPRILFMALETYSLVGGLQQFNRRVIVAEDLPKDLNVKCSAFGANRLAFVRESVKLARSIDVVLIGHINLLPVAWLLKSANQKLRLLLFVHGDEVWNSPNFRPRWFYEPWMLRWVNRIAAVSQYTASLMEREFSVPHDRFHIFPNAVDELPPPTPLQRKTETILVVTRIGAGDRRKNVDTVLRAFAQLAFNRPTATLEIVGEGVLRPELEDLACSLNISDRVRFLRFVSSSELEEAYRRASMFVLPSSKEGFGIVYLEAWQFGLPVICSSEGASKEIISDGLDGFVVDPRDTQSLANRIELLLSRPLVAANMGQQGYEKVAKFYLNKNFQENLNGIIRELVAI
jgi:phosphatidyl-myo-inositol dimannoside synthase